VFGAFLILTGIKMIVKREDEICPERNPVVKWFKPLFVVLLLVEISDYFALAGVLDKFHDLKVGLGVVLTFVGVKMLRAHTAWKIDTLVALGVIVFILAASVVMSLRRPKQTVLRPLPSESEN
jgi:tellurite resistance protein TerC